MRWALPVAIGLAVTAAACSSPATQSPQPTQPELLARVDTGEDIVGVSFDGGSLQLFIDDQTGDSELVTSNFESGHTPSVHLSSYGGETGRLYNTFVFGRAPEAATRFELRPLGAAVGGEVFQGTFVVAMRQRDVQPDQLVWAFLRADGSVLVDGIGITS